MRDTRQTDILEKDEVFHYFYPIVGTVFSKLIQNFHLCGCTHNWIHYCEIKMGTQNNFKIFNGLYLKLFQNFLKDMYFELEGVCEEKCSAFQCMGPGLYIISNYAVIQINNKAISHFRSVDEKVQLEVIEMKAGRLYIHGHVHVSLERIVA